MSLHQASVGVFEQILGSLNAILDKASAHAEARKIDPAALLQARLFPDMFGLAKQVQVTCDFALRGGARLAGVEVPNWPHEDATFEQLKARVARALAYVKGLDKAAIDGAASRDISFPMRDETVSMNGSRYLARFCMPNFQFHATCVYALLRHNGVELGKGDYLGDWRG